METQQYPGYDHLGDTGEEETVDFPFHGAGRKAIRHKYDAPDGEIEVHLHWSEIDGSESVHLHVQQKASPGRRTLSKANVIDFKFGRE